jgi:hypothetical protein
MARVPAKKAGARKATGRKATARKSTTRRVATRRTSTGSTATQAAAVTAAPAGTTDLAGGLRALLSSVEAEVRAVSSLSERIDDLVRQLNDARDEQAKRLIVLDSLRGAVDDTNLGTFLDKAIRPRRTRVEEIVPDRLTQG